MSAWQGTFEAETDEDLVIKQIVHNCNYWSSQMCKRETLEKYCLEKGVEDPAEVIDELTRRGIVYAPKRGYVGFTEPEKQGLKP